MQERYCACGCKVFVDYGPSRSLGNGVRFWSFCRLGGVTVRVCPKCGRALSIHGLR